MRHAVVAGYEAGLGLTKGSLIRTTINIRQSNSPNATVILRQLERRINQSAGVAGGTLDIVSSLPQGFYP